MNRRWPLLLGFLAGFAALTAGLLVGADTNEGWHLAARWTARVGFPLLIVTYSASALYRLTPGALSRDLLRNRRWWGLGFAACHTIHLAALVAFLRVSGTPPKPTTLIAGGFGYVLLFTMALTSNGAAMRALGRNWKRLHTFGIHWLWFVFAASYLGRAFRPETMIQGTIGSVIVLAALILRLAAWRAGPSRNRAMPA